MPERLTLVQRQQKLLEERGFSKRSASSAQTASFNARMERHLQATGRGNAVGASREKAELMDGESSMDDDVASICSRFSHAPSLHPSMVGTVMSQACHTETIGAGDGTEYWDYQHRTVQRQDLGHVCKECKRPFTTVGEPLTERRGARISMRYHATCFSGYADPRSQVSSSHHVGQLSGTQHNAAPGGKAGGKMRTSQHFDGGGALRLPHTTAKHNNSSGKSGMGLSMGSNGFGGRSSRGTGHSLADEDMRLSGLDMTPPAPLAGPGLSKSLLRAHDAGQDGGDDADVQTEGAMSCTSAALGKLGVVEEDREEEPGRT